MIEFLNANPGLSAIVAIVVGLFAIGAIQWRILVTLYVKPREFELERLARRLHEISQSQQQQFSRLENLPEPETSHPRNFHNDKPQQELSDVAGSSDSIRSTSFDSMGSFFRTVNSSKLTELQKDAAQKQAVGVVVTWSGKVNSIHEREDGRYSVFISPGRFTSGDVFCEFDKSSQSKLAKLRQGQKIRVKGKIEEVIGGYASLRDCELLSSDARG